MSAMIASASLGASVDMRAGPLQKAIEDTRSYAGLPRHDHTPDFRIAAVRNRKYSKEFRWIMDGRQRIGLLNFWIGEIEMFRFFPPPGGTRVAYRMPAVQHWATIQGPRITIVPQGTWTNRGQMVYLQDRGSELRLQYSERLEDGAELEQDYRLRFDSVLGYVWDCAFEMRSPQPRKFEYTNMLTGNLSDSRAGRKRYQKCLWTRRDGTLCYMYQSPLSMIQGGGAEWTDLPREGGFVGWVAERDFNPFLEIVQSSPPSTLVTCSQWYDQHVLNLPPSERDADGLYRISAAYRMLSVPLPVAKELEDAARTMLPAPKQGGAMGFRQGVVNDFEAPIPAGTLYVGCMWGHGVGLDTRTGHSGTCSLRVSGAAAQPIHGGTALHVETSRRYRLSAWVRTRGVTGGAFLRLNQVFWNWTDVRASKKSETLIGDNDWTRLEIEFKPVAGDPFAVPGLVVEGKGTAWFDDLALQEISR